MAEDESTDEKGGGLFGTPDISPLTNEIKKVGSTAKGLGLGVIAQRAIAGYFSTKLEQLRPDQLQTILDSGEMLANIVDEENEVVEETTNLLSTFGMSNKEIAQAVDTLITPQLVVETVREANEDVYNQIMTKDGAGRKWFVNQSEYLKEKL